MCHTTSHRGWITPLSGSGYLRTASGVALPTRTTPPICTSLETHDSICVRPRLPPCYPAPYRSEYPDRPLTIVTYDASEVANALYGT